MNYMEIISRWLLFVTLTVVLFACGGGGNGGGNSTAFGPGPVASQVEGGFESISTAAHNSKSSIQAKVNALTRGTSLADFSAKYSVNTYKIEYWTKNTSNNLVKVSGLIAVPVKESPSSLLSFQHGTIFFNSKAPSNTRILTGNDHPEIILASLGYIVFSPDYIGYGSSLGSEHPYLQRQTSANTTINLLKAGKRWLENQNITEDGRLFMTGYSQGGYVTMAALQAIQNQNLNSEGLTVTATVMGAGPYDLTTAIDTLVPINGVLSLLRVLSDRDLNRIIARLERQFIPNNSDIDFDSTFIRRFIEGDRQDNVHDWKSDLPIKLFHGRGDKTIPFAVAQSTRSAMRNKGSDIELIECPANPSGHLDCVLPYVDYMIRYFGGF